MATALRDIECSYILAEFGTSNIKYAGGDSVVKKNREPHERSH